MNNKIYFLIPTCEKYAAKANAIRDTWAKQASAFGFKYLFLIGRPDADSTYIKNDILYVPCRDDYESLLLKLVLGYEYIYQNFDFDYVYKIDDDCFLDIAYFKENIYPQLYTEKYFAGRILPSGSKLMTQYHFGKCTNPIFHKPYTKEEITFDLPLGGYGYILHKEILPIIYTLKSMIEEDLKNYTYAPEDVWIAETLYHEQINPVQIANHKSILAEQYEKSNKDDYYLIFDIGNPQLFYVIEENINTRRLPKNSEIKISILIPVYNREKFIGECLDSVLSQTLKEIEIIIVDDASTDGSIDIIHKYQQIDPRIRFYQNHTNLGVALTRNKLLQLAKGEFIISLDPDDFYVSRNILEKMYNEAIQNNADMVRGNLLAYHNEHKNTWKYTIGDQRLELFFDQKEITSFSNRKLLQLPLIHVTFLIRKNIAESIKIPNLQIGEDPIFLLSCLMKARQIICLPDIFYYYRVGHQSLSNKTSSLPITKSYDYIKHLLIIKEIYLSHGYKKAYNSYLLSCTHRFIEMKRSYSLKLNHTGFYLYLLQVFKDMKIEYDPDISTKDSYDLLMKFIDDIEQFVDTNATYKEIQTLVEKGITQNLHDQEIWLINERGWDARDNGYAFYKYIKREHPEINAYYVITKDSCDYEKIKTIDDDSIIEYQSDKHKLYYLFSKFIISSQGGDHCHPLDYAYLKSNHANTFKSRYIFLQHGISKNYIHYFHKGSFHNALFVISGEMEQELMTDSYQYTPWDLAETGFSRFDMLENKEKKKEPFIFFMPTWRSDIKDEKSFLASNYYTTLQSLFHSGEFIELLEQYNINLKFLIHPNFSRYSHLLTTNSKHIKILPGDSDISSLIQECTFAITDYSSFIFDVAYQKKNIIYYHYDYEHFRKHHYKESPVFSYKKHGLGRVVGSEKALIHEIRNILTNKEQALKPYLERYDYIFKYNDKNSSKRIYQAINQYENLSNELAAIYKSEKLHKVGIFKAFTKEDMLILFLEASNKHGLFVEPFDIDYYLLGDSIKSQRVNLATASYVLYINDKPLYVFYTRIPKYCYKLEIYKDYIFLESPIMNKDTINIAMPLYTLRGGAGIAAKRLHDGLLGLGINDVIFEKENSNNKYNMVYHDKSNQINGNLSNINNSKNIHPGNTIFTITPSYSKLSDYDFLLNFDIINIHWIANYLPTEAIAYLSHSNKPIVWTFHDKNPLTGGCHYFHGCENWKTDCMNCPQLIDNYDNYPAKILAAKKKYVNFKNITVVVLNQHFKELVEESPLFNESRIEVIPNSIDTDKFIPLDKKQIRESFGLEENKKYLLYVAAYASTIKGYKEFEQTTAAYAKRYGSENIEILLAGNLPKNRNIELPFREFGHVNEEKIIELYNASDVTVLSSIEDNLPNVILESLSCGTPVVGFKVGGLPDMIENGYNGYTVELGDIEGLATSIHKVLEGDDLSANCRAYAEKNLKLEVQAKRYKTLYEDLLSTPVEATGKQELTPEVFPETAPTVMRLLNEIISLKDTQLKQKDTQTKQQQNTIKALQNNRWYRFGKLSRKQKIWVAGKVLSKKMKIHSALKPIVQTMKKIPKSNKK